MTDKEYFIIYKSEVISSLLQINVVIEESELNTLSLINLIKLQDLINEIKDLIQLNK
jgi:hypothetical protein